MYKIKFSKKLALFLIVTLIIGMFTACGGNEQPSQDTSDKTELLTGVINAGGSTSVEKAAKKALEEFVALNPGVTYEYDATGSSTGMKNAADGTYHLGFASRELKDSEKETGMTHMPIALDGVAVVVNPENVVDGLTIQQIQAIYKGEITNWSEVGGEHASIVVVSRENGSGTRGAYEEIVGFEDELLEGAIIKDGNGNVATYVAEEKNAVGYISFTTLNANTDKIKGLKIAGAEPTVENVQEGTYEISRPFNMAYHEGNLNEAEKAFVDFLFTEEGQDAVEDAGAIKIK